MENTTQTFMTLGLPNIMWDGGNPNAQGITTTIVVRWVDYPFTLNMFGGTGRTECCIFHSDIFGLRRAARTWANCSASDKFDMVYGREIALARAIRTIRNRKGHYACSTMQVVVNMLESATVRKTLWWLFFDKHGFETRKNAVFAKAVEPPAQDATLTKPITSPIAVGIAELWRLAELVDIGKRAKRKIAHEDKLDATLNAVINNLKQFPEELHRDDMLGKDNSRPVLSYIKV